MKNIALAILSVGLCFYEAYRFKELHRLYLTDAEFDPRERYDLLAGFISILAAIGVFLV